MANALRDRIDAHLDEPSASVLTDSVNDTFYDVGRVSQEVIKVSAGIPPHQVYPVIMDAAGNYYEQGFQMEYGANWNANVTIELTLPPGWEAAPVTGAPWSKEEGTNTWIYTIPAALFTTLEGWDNATVDIPFYIQSSGKNAMLRHDPGIRITPPTN